MNICKESLKNMDERYRVNLINSLTGFKSASLIGTSDLDKKTNLAIMSSVVHLGASPSLIGLIIRPSSVPRHTYENIKNTKFFSVNHIRADFIDKAHQTSARYDKEQSEFSECNLEEFYTSYSSPYVKESHIKYMCEFREEIPIDINNTILIIGEIVEILMPEEVIGHDGFIDLEMAGTITCSGLDRYHSTNHLARFSYAKPNRWPEKVTF